MKRKSLAITIFICLLFHNIFFHKTAYPIIKFSLPEYTIHLDDSGWIPVNLISNESVGIYAWDFSIIYDPDILTYLGWDEQRDYALTKNLWMEAHESTPGRINVSGFAWYHSKEYPIKNTGLFMKIRLSSKRCYPMQKTRSTLDMSFINVPANDLQNAICDPGEIVIQPLSNSNIHILSVEPSEGICWQAENIAIYGTGFQQDTIPVIGPFQIDDISIDLQNGLITVPIPDAIGLAHGLIFDILVTNPNGDFDVINDGYMMACQFEQGLNLFGYPTIPPEEYSHSHELLSYLGQNDGDKIHRLMAIDPNTLKWHETRWQNDQPVGADFQLDSLRGNILYVVGMDFSRAFRGKWNNPDLNSQINILTQQIKPGTNLITLHPPLNEIINSHQVARDLSQKIGKEISLNSIQSKTSKWQTTLTFFGRIMGDEFEIRNADGYILYKQ